jgi:hypothetical protein
MSVSHRQEIVLERRLTVSQLEHLEEHIPYELLMLRFTLGRLKGEKHPLAWNAMLESFAVHARNLYWFLINKRNHQEDHVASDFTVSYMVPSKSAMMGPFQRLNQQVMHLGTQRKKADTEKFQSDDAEKVAKWIEGALPKFREALIPDLRQRFKLDAIPQCGSASFEKPMALPRQTSSSFPQFWLIEIAK